jgi:hypothetical protein
MTEDEQAGAGLERELDDMQRHSDQLKEDIAGARQDWEAKKADEQVPGTPPSEGGEDESGDAREPWPDE